MGVNFKTQDKTLIAFISGEVDHHTAMSIRYAIDKAMVNLECINLIMDLSKVSFMDSSGIGLILGRYKKVNKMSGQIYISGCRRHVEKVLSMSDVFSLIPKYDNYEDVFQCELEVTNG